MALRTKVTLPALVTTVAIVVGGACRFWYVLVAHPPMNFDYSDMHGYITSAERIADPTIRTTLFDWYYPRGAALVLAAFLRLFGASGWHWAALWQAAMSTVEIYLVYALTRSMANARAAAMAAALFALHYLSVSYSGFFLSENYLTFALIVAFLCLAPGKPGRCALAGLAFGLGAWVKSQAFLLPVLLAAWLLVRRRGARSASALLVGSLAVVVPASIMTSHMAGRPTFISLNGGQTFCLSQCPYHTIKFRTNEGEMTFGLPSVYQRAGRHEAEEKWIDAFYNVSFIDNGFYMKEGVKCVTREPWRACKLAVLHLADIFAGPPWSPIVPWPESATSWSGWAAASNFILSYVIAPLAFYGVWRGRRNEMLLMVFTTSLAAIAASAVLFHGDPRFREPYDFVFLLAAASGLDAIMARLQNRFWPQGAAAEAP